MSDTTYTLGFHNKAYDNYTDYSLEDAEEAAREEFEKAISDSGSDAYDLDYPPLPWTSSLGKTFDNTDDIWNDDAADAEFVSESHARGIKAAVERDFPAFWRRLMDGGSVKLPHVHATMYLEPEEEDDDA